MDLEWKLLTKEEIEALKGQELPLISPKEEVSIVYRAYLEERVYVLAFSGNESVEGKSETFLLGMRVVNNGIVTSSISPRKCGEKEINCINSTLMKYDINYQAIIDSLKEFEKNLINNN